MGRRNQKSKPIEFLHGSSVSFSQWNRAYCPRIPPSCVGTHLVLKHENHVACTRRQLGNKNHHRNMVGWSRVPSCSRLMKLAIFSPKHGIAMRLCIIPKTWCMLHTYAHGNPWHLLLSVQVSKCCELPAQQRCINHHLGITKNWNKKELHWEVHLLHYVTLLKWFLACDIA